MTDSDQYSAAETKRRMEAAIRRAQKTPPAPHTAKAKKATSRAKATSKKPKSLA